MAETVEHPPDELTADELNPQVHHEESDVDTRAILWFIGGFVAFAIVVHVVVALLFFGMKDWTEKRQPAPITEVSGVGRQAPPAPQLQPFPPNQPPFPGLEGATVSDTPAWDMARMRKEENERLETYGWVDREAGVVRIPIDQAIDIVAQEQLPVRPAASAAAPEKSSAVPKTNPAEVGSARVIGTSP